MKPISFLTDYGLADEFVGVCKGVIHQLAPGAPVIDITHNVLPHDIRAGSLALVRSVQYLPDGIVLAIVDPGVGGDRKTIAVEVENGVLIGPDNGLLAPSVAMLGGAVRAFSLDNTEYQLLAPGGTFAGRDVMAPAVGHLAAGVPLTELGSEVDAALLVPGLLPLPEEGEDGTVKGEVLWVDRFGNVQLNIDPDMLTARGVAIGDSLELRYREEVRGVRWISTYSEGKPSELVVVTDSYGLLALAIDRQSAAKQANLSVGTIVTIVPAPPRGGR